MSPLGDYGAVETHPREPARPRRARLRIGVLCVAAAALSAATTHARAGSRPAGLLASRCAALAQFACETSSTCAWRAHDATCVAEVLSAATDYAATTASGTPAAYDGAPAAAEDGDERETETLGERRPETFGNSSRRRVELTVEDFLQFPKVVAALKATAPGFADLPLASWADNVTSPTNPLLDFLPLRITVEIDAAAMQGVAGSTAVGGLVAFNLYNPPQVSWNVVIDVASGTLVQLAPVPRDAWATSAENHEHVNAIKNFDETSLLIVGDVNYTGTGPAYVWDWAADNFTQLLPHHVDSHDIQWSCCADAFWVQTPDADTWAGFNACKDTCATNLTLVDRASGNVLWQMENPYSGNHISFADAESAVYLSWDDQDGIAKFAIDTARPRSQKLQWILGGPLGTLPIVGFDNQTFANATSVFVKQHNVECVSTSPRPPRVASKLGPIFGPAQDGGGFDDVRVCFFFAAGTWATTRSGCLTA